MIKDRGIKDIALWDYYIIYAIILGENEKIIDDILKVDKINISNIKSILEI